MAANYFKYVFTDLQRSLLIDSIISFHYYDFRPNYIGENESHNFWEMVYVDAGRIVCHAGDEFVPLTQGQAVFHPPSERHNLHTEDSSCSICILSFSCRQLDSAQFHARAVQFGKDETAIVGMIYKEGNVLFKPPYNLLRQAQLFKREAVPFGSEQILRNLMENLMVMVVRGIRDSSRQITGGAMHPDSGARRRHYSEDLIAESIVGFLKSNIYRKLTIPEICRLTAFSQSHIEAVFRRQIGESVMRHFNRLKIEKAKQMIGEGKYTFTQISAALGFSSIHYFSRVFHGYVNMYPMEYEKSVKRTGLL